MYNQGELGMEIAIENTTTVQFISIHEFFVFF